MEVLIIRHGYTELNKTGKTQGQTIDDHLSSEGVVEVEELAQLLPKNIDKMYVSDLSRTRETAEIVNKVLNTEIVLDSRLREVGLGDLTGKTWKEMGDYYGEDIGGEYIYQKYNFRRFGGESAEDVRQRVFELFEHIKDNDSGKNILLITHAGIIRFLQYELEGKLKEKIDNKTIHKFLI